MMTFKRNQIEEALWRFFSRDSAGRKPAATFRTRIKRLIELDRQTELTDGMHRAFGTAEDLGRGVEARFTEFDTFCLCVGLLLLNAGFKQAEIVFLLQHVQADLQDAWSIVERSPAVPRQRLLAKDRPNAPSRTINGFDIADTHVFLILNKVELTEVFPQGPSEKPMIYAPLIVRGTAALSEALFERSVSFPGHFVLEVSIMISSIRSFLKESEPKRRGPG